MPGAGADSEDAPEAFSGVPNKEELKQRIADKRKGDVKKGGKDDKPEDKKGDAMEKE